LTSPSAVGFNPAARLPCADLERTFALRILLPLFAFLVAGCAGGGAVPTTDVRDYRVTIRAAETTSSCTQMAEDAADAWVESSLVYRFHWVDGPTSSRVDLYWRENGEDESDFTWFAAGVLEGELDSGTFVYAGRGFRSERATGSVLFDI
jgi:hypothetical protein